MPKRAKKTESTCEEHLFILKPKQNFCRFGQTASISFCESIKDKNKNKNKKCRNCQSLDCPVFNRDNNFATPTFILTSEKTYYEERGHKMKEQHEKKMIEYTDEKDSLNIPKPRTRNNFCSVCRQIYQDYLQHIRGDRHKKKIGSSVFNQYILDIAEKFNPNCKNIPGFYQTLSTRDEDDVEVIENKPIKKVKTEYEAHERFSYMPDYMRSQIAPPPHLNINNTAYFPRFGQDGGFGMGQQNNFHYPAHVNNALTFNYNMNIFMNANPYMANPYNFFYNLNPYGVMNPWVDYLQFQTPINPSYPKPDQNYILPPMYHQKMDRQYPQFTQAGQKCEDKKETIVQKQPFIVIDDDQGSMQEKPEFKQ